jgi:hypothetical protein
MSTLTWGIKTGIKTKMASNTDFYSDRRPNPAREGDQDTALGYHSLRQANREILDSTPSWRRDEMQTKIHTNAVHRHRGKVAFSNIGEYKNFIYGTEE